MLKKILVSILAIGLLAAVVMVVGQMKRGSNATPTEYLWAGPIKLKYNPELKTGVMATLDGREVTESDLLSRSKLLEELAALETRLLLEAIDRKLGTNSGGGTKVEIFRPAPNETFVATLKADPKAEISFSPRRADGVVAKINGNSVDRKDLSLNQVRYSEVKKAEIDETLSLLKGIFMRQLLLYKAKEANTDIEGLIKANVIKQDAPVSEEDIDRFAQENGLIPPPKDKNTRNRLKIIIADKRRTAAVDAYAKVQFANKQGEIAIKMPDFTIPLSENLALIEQKQNSSDTPVIYFFGNLLCGSCAGLLSDLTALKEDLKGGLRVGFVNLFSDGDWRSRLVAESSQCLSAQGYDYFWKFANQAAREGETITEQKIYELVKVTGADFPTFQTCLLKQTYRQTVQDQLKYAADLGVTRVPTVIIGSRVLTGTISREEMTNIVRSESTRPEKGAGGWLNSLKR